MRRMIAVLAVIGAAGSVSAQIVPQGTGLHDAITRNGVVTSQTIDLPDAFGWSFWTFGANAGDNITITVRRTVTGNMDPASSVLFGDATGLPFASLTGINVFDWSGPGLSANIASGDDDLPPNIPGPFGDPQYSFIAATTGIYTAAVADFLGNGTPPFTHNITVTGSTFVPAPGAAALLGLGGLLVSRRRRRA